jgi:hypothetical protein
MSEELQKASQFVLKNCVWFKLFSSALWIAKPKQKEISDVLDLITDDWQGMYDAITIITGRRPEGWPLGFVLDHFEPNGSIGSMRQVGALFLRRNHPLNVRHRKYKTLYKHPALKDLSFFYKPFMPECFQSTWIIPILLEATASPKIIQSIFHQLIDHLTRKAREYVITWADIRPLVILSLRFDLECEIGVWKYEEFIERIQRSDLRFFLFKFGIFHLEKCSRPLKSHVDTRRIFNWKVRQQSFVDNLLMSGAGRE